MKDPSQPTGGESGTKTIVARQYTEIDHEKVCKVAQILEPDGFILEFANIELWQHRCVIIARNPQTQEGFLLDVSDFGHVIRYGLPYLRGFPDSSPRAKNVDRQSRVRRYAEKVLARAVHEVQTSSPGVRNATLSRAAYGVGRFLLGWELERDDVAAQLLEAAESVGLSHHEASSTIKSSLKAGSRKPKSPDELLDDLVNGAAFDEQWSSSNKSQAQSSKSAFHEQKNNQYRGWAKPSPWGR
jgi:hypothetical protein